MVSVEQRFWSKVDRAGECWRWKAGLDRQGYGSFTVVRGVSVRAQHFAWTLARGPLPETARVAQRCGSRQCVRADHLYLSRARRAPSRRRLPRSRRARGVPAQVERELATLAAIELHAVRMVHAIGGRPPELARLLGVSEQTIREILRQPTPPG